MFRSLHEYRNIIFGFIYNAELALFSIFECNLHEASLSAIVRCYDKVN